MGRQFRMIFDDCFVEIAFNTIYQFGDDQVGPVYLIAAKQFLIAQKFFESAK